LFPNVFFLASPGPARNVRRHAPVATLHSLTKPSYEPEHTVVPSGEKRTEVTGSECAGSTFMHVPLRTSHKRTVSSTDPVTNTFPAGLRSTEKTCAVCPANTRKHSPKNAGRSLGTFDASSSSF
jgi:hypothetical protein